MSAFKIYGIPLSRAFRPLWCANELGVRYENVPIHFAGGQTKTPEFLAINPNGKLPAIENDGFNLSESMAINFYLAKKFGGDLIPGGIEGEARVLQWSFWAVYELEKQLLATWLNRSLLPEEKRNAAAADEAEKQIQRPLKVLESALKNTGYLIGNKFTLADLNVAAVMSWARSGKVDITAYPNTEKWLDACLDREAAKKAKG
jgi:glutathione S-transferase